MARNNVIPKEVAEKVLEAFRSRPGRTFTVAKLAGIDPRTAKRAWNCGLMTCPDSQYHRPFEQILLEEQQAVRARAAQEEKAAANKFGELEARRRADTHAAALDDVTKQRAQEEVLVRNARAATIVLLSNVTTLAAGVSTLGQKVRQSLEERANQAKDLTVMEARHIVTIIGKLGSTLRQCNEAGQKSMEMSRLLAGEPTSITGHKVLEPMTIDEAKQRVSAAQRAVARLEQAGLDSLDGNSAAADPSFN